MKLDSKRMLPVIAVVAFTLVFAGCPKKDTMMPTTTPVETIPAAPAAPAAPKAAVPAAPAVKAAPDAIESADIPTEPSPDEMALSEAERSASGSSDEESTELAAARLAAAKAAAASTGAGALGAEERGMLASFTVYFDFDSAEIRADQLSILNQAADMLAANTKLKIVLTGHCDERGTPEYNLALGQRRAENVRDYLLEKGVPAGILETVSMGEEDPVDKGHNEEAWAKNRRVAFQAK